MAQNLLQVTNLKVSADEKVILEGLDLTVNKGETHVLMGQNGAGKSTLGAAIMGSPAFTVEAGEILFDGQDITHQSPDVRAKAGVFLSFQTPEEVPGITLENFLRVAKGAVTGEPPRILPFRKALSAEMEELQMAPEYAKRDLNVGFSGGERKKSEVLQMLTLNPKLAILDETDSGLDVDAVRTVARGVREFRTDENALLIITHNAKLLEGMQIDKVHVLVGGKIATTGGPELVDLITKHGFCAIVDENGKCLMSGEDGGCAVGEVCEPAAMPGGAR
ncbi:Fe-S cluster assembly ATPase SufC [Ruminococcaceae bacterium OttesenSCG-928-A16]|nr:Fe-S cluster assembly ATPase SufC [Ruminococcaceae bacterium OttesenSCG-928-A16]